MFCGYAAVPRKTEFKIIVSETQFIERIAVRIFVNSFAGRFIFCIFVFFNIIIIIIRANVEDEEKQNKRAEK